MRLLTRTVPTAPSLCSRQGTPYRGSCRLSALLYPSELSTRDPGSISKRLAPAPVADSVLLERGRLTDMWAAGWRRSPQLKASNFHNYAFLVNTAEVITVVKTTLSHTENVCRGDHLYASKIHESCAAEHHVPACPSSMALEQHHGYRINSNKSC